MVKDGKGETAMGQLVEANCTACGYTAKASVGGLRNNFHLFHPFPALCVECEEIREVNVRKSPLTCLECNSTKVSVYGEKTRLAGSEQRAGDTYDPLPNVKPPWDAGHHVCPKCNNYGINFAARRSFFD